MSDHFEPVALADEAIAELERSLSGTVLGPRDPRADGILSTGAGGELGRSEQSCRQPAPLATVARASNRRP
jgi:hypothetical protein